MRVRPGRLITAAACCAAVTAVPASIAHATSASRARTGATLSTAGTLSTGAAPVTGAPPATTRQAAPAPVTVSADPVRPEVGQRVHLTVLAPPPGASAFAWDLTGRSAFARHTGHSAQTEVAFATPGIHSVAVRFMAGGQVRLAVATVNVASRPLSHPAGGLSGRITAHAAGDPAVTIADFHFAPAATTIHVGDTITWSNNGPSSHTATASNGSFDTGILKKGQSASHTFTQAGTFTYICQIHPFMKGTIVVLASTTSTASSTATTPATTTPAATTAATSTVAAQTGPSLPNTGFNVLAGLSAGLLLLSLGAALRRTHAR